MIITNTEWAIISRPSGTTQPQINIGTDNGGAIFYAPFGITDIYFKKNAKYCQWGMCTVSATMPTIISAGTGRLNFKTDTNTNGYIHTSISDAIIDFNIAQAHFFIGGNAGLRITNVYAIARKPD